MQHTACQTLIRWLDSQVDRVISAQIATVAETIVRTRVAADPQQTVELDLLAQRLLTRATSLLAHADAPTALDCARALEQLTQPEPATVRPAPVAAAA